MRRVLRCGIGLAAAVTLPTSLLAQSAGPRVVFERTGYRLTALGAKVSVSARVLDAQQLAVPNAPIAYRTSDPAIAVVTAPGVVQSRRVGRTRVWAVSGTDSGSALIVVDQWASTFAFTPSPVQFDAIGAGEALKLQLRDATGNAIPDAGRRTAQCRSRDTTVAAMSTSGQVTARANGVTFVRCTDRGISDSVRVVVSQRPLRVEIAEKLKIGAKNPKDTFTLRAQAFDPLGVSIPGARATWVSLASGAVSIDPVSGFARAISVGTARIVTQAGDATDTVTVIVTSLGSEVVSTGTDTTVVRQPTLELPVLSLIVGDTTTFTFVARDAQGSRISNAEKFVALQSSNESVVAVLKNKRIVATATGAAYIVARFANAGISITDSTLVGTRARGTGQSRQSSAEAATIAFARPVFDTAAAQVRNRRQIDSMFRVIREGGIGRTTTSRALSFEAIAAQARHSTRLSTSVVETRSGFLIGGRANLVPIRRLVLSGTFKTGSLLPTTVGENLTVAEMDGQVAVWPVSWFGIGGGYMQRGERTELGGLQKWTVPSLSAMTSGTFVGGAASMFTAISLFPASKYTGRPTDAQPKKTSLAGEVGLDLRLTHLTGGFSYYVESFKFAAVGTNPVRVDQFSTLRLRLGAKFGR